MFRRMALFAAAFTLAACADSPTQPPDIQGMYGEGGDGLVSQPFQAELFTDLAGLVPDPACGAPPRFLNTQVGEGEATYLGRFSIRITFCVDATDLLDDGLLTPGESVPYDNGVGILIAANGDELYMEIAGVVLPSSDPAFDFEFQDPFTFTGGTGRFVGATGGGMTDSVVEQATNRTYHDWAGTLVLPYGN